MNEVLEIANKLLEITKTLLHVGLVATVAELIYVIIRALRED